MSFSVLLTCLVLFHKIRSSRSQMFFKISVLKNFAVFTGKHQLWSLFLIKLQTWRSAKRLQHRCFPVNIAKFLRTPPVAASVKWWNSTKMFVNFFSHRLTSRSRKNTIEKYSIYWNVLLSSRQSGIPVWNVLHVIAQNVI